MEDVDYPRAWLKLKAYVGGKRGHGQDDLFAEMSRIEVECSEISTPMTRPKEKQHQDRPPSQRDASASRTDAPEPTHPLPPKEARKNGNGHHAAAGQH